MDVLYVIGRGSKWDNNELKYSLRSLDANCKNVGRIFIVGYCPDFIDKTNVTFIPCEDKYNFKHQNIMRCIETAVKKSDISDDFLYSSDDHFYISAADFDNYPFFRKSTELPAKYDPAKSYHRTLTSTRIVLEDAGLTYYNFAWHGNTHFNKTLFLEDAFQEMWQRGYNMPSGIEPTILMLNYWYSRRPFEITDREDRKFPAEISPDRLVQGMQGRECISCASNTPGVIIRFLRDTFRNKSQYEL